MEGETCMRNYASGYLPDTINTILLTCIA